MLAEAKDYLDLADSRELEARFEDAKADRDEDDYRDDLVLLKDELDYLIELYTDKDSASQIYYVQHKNAKKIVKETKNGKEIPMSISGIMGGGNAFKYSKAEISEAQGLIAEIKRLKTTQKHLAAYLSANPRDCLSCSHSHSEEAPDGDILHCMEQNGKVVPCSHCCKDWN